MSETVGMHPSFSGVWGHGPSFPRVQAQLGGLLRVTRGLTRLRAALPFIPACSARLLSRVVGAAAPGTCESWWETAVCEVSALRQLLPALENVVHNIAGHPDDVQLRIIRLANANFHTKIGEVPLFFRAMRTVVRSRILSSVRFTWHCSLQRTKRQH